MVGVSEAVFKAHTVTDGLGHSLRFLLSHGNRNDICMVQALLEYFDLNGKLILADKDCDSDQFVCWLKECGGIVVIPSCIIAKPLRKTDWHTYKERHLVENLFLKLKNNRRFATRYEEENSLFPRRLTALPRSLDRIGRPSNGINMAVPTTTATQTRMLNTILTLV